MKRLLLSLLALIVGLLSVSAQQQWTIGDVVTSASGLSDDGLYVLQSTRKPSYSYLTDRGAGTIAYPNTHNSLSTAAFWRITSNGDGTYKVQNYATGNYVGTPTSEGSLPTTADASSAGAVALRFGSAGAAFPSIYVAPSTPTVTLNGGNTSSGQGQTYTQATSSGVTTVTSNAASGMAGLTLSVSTGTLGYGTYYSTYRCMEYNVGAATTDETFTLTAPSGYVITGYDIAANRYGSSTSNFTLTSADGTVTTSVTSYSNQGTTPNFSVSGLDATSTTFTINAEAATGRMVIPYFVVYLQQSTASTYYWDRGNETVWAFGTESPNETDNAQCYNIYPVTIGAPAAVATPDRSVNYIPSSTPATSVTEGVNYLLKDKNSNKYMYAASGVDRVQVGTAMPSFSGVFRLTSQKQGATSFEGSYNADESYGSFLQVYGRFLTALSGTDNDPVNFGENTSAAAYTITAASSGSSDFYLSESTNGSDVGIKYGNTVLTPFAFWRSGQAEVNFYPVETEVPTAIFDASAKTMEVSTTAATTIKEGFYVMQSVKNSRYVYDNAASYNLTLTEDAASELNVVQVVSTGTAGQYYIKSYSGRYFSPLEDNINVPTGWQTPYTIEATSTSGEFYLYTDSGIYMGLNGTSNPKGVTSGWKDEANEGHWVFYPVELVNVPVSAATEYTVQVRNATGKEYNGTHDNNSRWYTNWYCTVSEPYDLYTMTLQATYNNLAFRHFREDNTTEYADGAFAAAYGQTHDKMTLTAPDGWYLKSVRMRGVSLGNVPNYIGSTVYKTKLSYSKTSGGTASEISPSKFYDFINATTGTIDDDAKVYVGGVETGAATALLNGGTCYHVFKAANSGELGLGTVATAMASDSVTEFTHTFTDQPTSWSFHVNGDNGSPVVMQMWVTLVKCDEVAGVTITVQDEDGTVLASGLKRNVRFGPRNEVYVPYDLRRDFFSSSVLESRATIESTGTATVKYANGSLPFRIASSPTDKENLYYMGFGDKNSPRFLSYTADGAALPFANETEDVEAEWFGFTGNPYDGYLITNYSAGADKYLTSAKAADGVQPTFVADADYNPVTQTRRWYPSRAVNTHSDGKKYGSNYGTQLPATAATHFYLAPVKDDGGSFADCDVTWHYNRLGNCTESALTYQIGRDEANQKAALSIYEIRNWELRLINSEYPDYGDGKADVTLYDVRELQTLALQDSHLARDFVSLAGSVTGDTYHHTTAGGYAREERNYTNTLFRVSPDPANPIYYGMAMRYNDWRWLRYESDKAYIGVYDVDAVSADEFIDNDNAKWFFQGNAWDGFQIFTVGSGSTKTLVTDTPVGSNEYGRDVQVSFRETANINADTQTNTWLFHKAVKSTTSPFTYYGPYDTDYLPFNLTPAKFNTYYQASEKYGYNDDNTRRFYQLNNRNINGTTSGISYWTAHADNGSAFILKPITELTYVYNLWDDAYSTTTPRYTTSVRVLHGLTKTLDFRNINGVSWLRDFCTYTRTQDFNLDGTVNGTTSSIKLWTIDLPNELSPTQAMALRDAREAAGLSSDAVITRDLHYNFTLFKTAADVSNPTEAELYYFAARADDNHTVVLYNGNLQTVTAPTTTTDDSNNTISNSKGGGLNKQKWFFAGNPYDGFVFYNLAATSSYALAAGTAHSGNTSMQVYDPDDTDHTFLWRPDSCYISANNYGFRYHDRNCFNLYAHAYDAYRTATGNCLNRVSYNIGFWSGNDVGSRFFLVPVSTIQEFTYQIVDAEGNVVAGPVTETINDGDKRTYNLATDYPALLRDFCTYTLDGAAFDLTADITKDNTSGDGMKETYNILYTWNGPFELSTEELPVWYLMKLKPTIEGKSSVFVNGTDTSTGKGTAYTQSSLTLTSVAASGMAGVTLTSTGGSFDAANWGATRCLTVKPSSETTPDTWTITAPTGYAITGYSLGAWKYAGDSYTYTFTVDGTDYAVTSSSDTGTTPLFTVSGLSSSSASFSLMGTTNQWLAVSYLTVSLAPLASAVEEEIANGTETPRHYVVYDATRTAETDVQGFKTETGWNDELNLADNYVMKYIIDGTGLWAFEGDPYNNFKILNRSDASMALNATNVDNSATYAPLLAAKASAIKWEVTKNTNGGVSTGFNLRAITANANDYLNFRIDGTVGAAGQLSYWQNSNAKNNVGSQFFVEKMTPYVKTYIERYTVAPEQTFYGVASNNERTALADLVADIATIDQTGSSYTYKNESDGLADASAYVFNTKKTEPHTGSFRLLFKYRDVYASLSNNGTYNASTTDPYVPGTSTTAQLWANIAHSATDQLMRNLSSVVCFEKESEDATAGTVNGYLTVQGMKSPATTTNSNLNFSNSGTGEVRIFKTDYAPYSFISTNPDETSMTNKTFYHRNNQNYVQTWLANEAGSTLYVVPATKIQTKVREAIDGRYYATLAVPFPISTGSSKSNAYYLDNTDGEALTVNDSGTRASVRTNQIAGVPAGTPVILAATNIDVATSDEAFFQLDIPSASVAATYSTDVSNNLLQGCYMPTPQTTVTNTFTADEKLYAFAQSKTFEGTTEVGFFPYSGTNLAANRIYLVYDHEAAKNASASAPAAILLDIDGASLDVAISSAGYSTLYYDLPLVVPEGIEAAIVSVSDEQLNIDYCYPAGSVIPAETGVLLRGEEGRYVFNLTDEDGTTYAGNQLRGTLTDALTDEGGTAYKLAVGEDGLPGFYLGDPDGGRFVNQAYKAYLFLTEGQLVRGFNFDDAVSTGVGSNNLTSGEDNAGKNLPVFDAQGRRVGKQKLMPGVYIMNGKKVFIK